MFFRNTYFNWLVVVVGEKKRQTKEIEESGKFKERPSWKGWDRMKREKEDHLSGHVGAWTRRAECRQNRRNWKRPRRTWKERKKDKENGWRQAKRRTVRQPKRKTDKRDRGKYQRKGHNGKGELRWSRANKTTCLAKWGLEREGQVRGRGAKTEGKGEMEKCRLVFCTFLFKIICCFRKEDDITACLLLPFETLNFQVIIFGSKGLRDIGKGLDYHRGLRYKADIGFKC